MTSASHSPASRSLVATAACVIVVAGMKIAAPLVIPFLLSIFIAIVCAPSLYWLQSKKVPTAVALIIVIAVMAILALGLVALVGSSVTSFASNLGVYEAGLKMHFDGVLQWLERHEILDWVKRSTGADPIESIRSSLNIGAAAQFAGGMVTGLSGVFGNAFLIGLTVIFILLEASGFSEKLRAISDGADDAQRQFDRIVTDVRRYVALKTWMCLATGVLVTVFLFFMKVDFPFLWGTLAFLLNYVPNIGSFIAAIPPVILALVQLGWAGAAGTAMGFAVINIVIGNVIEPRVMGRGLGLSTLVVFVSLVFWGWVLGPVGMLLSAPLTMVVKISLENQTETRWIAILLSSDATIDDDTTSMTDEPTATP